MPTYSTGDLVVLLPGITGSTLACRGKAAWGASAGALMHALVSGGDSIQNLALDGDDPARDDLGDGVTATGLVQDITLIPGFWKIDGYSKASGVLQQAFGLARGENFLEFAYDWRRDCRVAARKLEREAGDRLRAWRVKSGNADAKLVLAAHSMGGLVARYFLEALGGWRDTRALITFGTPYRGSLSALGYIANGYRQGVGPLSLDLAPVLRSLTSVYQLLPVYPCIDAGDGTLKRIVETPGLPHMDDARAAAALAFHREIEAAQAENAKLAAYRDAGYRIYPIVGFEQPTFQSATFSNGVVELLRSRQGRDESGDGTVPRISATPLELSDARREIFAAEKHGSLQNNDGVLAQVRGVLSAAAVDLRSVRAGPPISLRLSLADAFAANEPVQLEVRTSDERPRLQVAIVSATSGVTVYAGTLHSQRDDTQKLTIDPLPADFYRATVSGDARVSPVTDIFVVAQ